MTPSSDLQERIRRYLLGNLPEAEQEEIEKDLLTSSDRLEELLVIEDELIDDYLSGELTADDRTAFETYFLATPQRHDQLRFGRAFQNILSQKRRLTTPPVEAVAAQSSWRRFLVSSPWSTAVVAIVVVGMALGSWRLFFRQSEVDKGLVALNSACRNSRPIEARISDLSYSPYLTTRGGRPSQTDQEKLRLAELDFKQALNTRTSSEALHGLGKVYLARQDFDQAIEQLEKAAASDSNNPRLYNDLGIAWMEKGLTGGELGPDENRRALEYLNQALRLNPQLPEAIFNRALCHELLGQTKEARQDWETYLEVDANSPWSIEARERLGKLSGTPR
jgi:tetratricopeptide (TPR) repeat protein